MSEHNARLAVVTCTPMAKKEGPTGELIYEPLDPRWHRARMGLSMGTNINTSELCVDGLEVGDARSRIASACLGMPVKPRYLFFLDSDVIVPNDAFTKLFYHLQTRPNIDIACGIYVCKGAPPFDPLIYQGNGMGAFWDFAVGDILTTKTHDITACHMGLTLIRTSLFQRMKDAYLVHGDGTDQEDEPFFCTEQYQVDTPTGPAAYRGTEDIYFCAKAAKLDPPCQILVDTSVLSGHVDRNTGVVYGLPGNTSPIERAKWLPTADGSGLRRDRKEANDKGLKLAIDLGAGESRREWEGHITYTLDSRKESGADYIQYLPKLNLPENHYDLVASRHSFEHVGRWEQEILWSEVYRICKPGGRLEVIVPNIEWAGEKIAEGEVDDHVLNVLYGSQEADKEINSREANHHLFGYTPKILKALAEGAGFVDVQIIDYKADPTCTYHMYVKGRKPDTNEQVQKGEAEGESKDANGVAIGSRGSNGDADTAPALAPALTSATPTNADTNGDSDSNGAATRKKRTVAKANRERRDRGAVNGGPAVRGKQQGKGIDTAQSPADEGRQDKSQPGNRLRVMSAKKVGSKKGKQ